MTIRRATILLYLVSFLLCVVAAQYTLAVSDRIVEPEAILAGAAYALLVAVLLVLVRGEAAIAFVVAALAIWIGYVFRFLYMILAGALYRYPYSNVLALESSYVTSAFGFMALGTVAWALGATVAGQGADFVRLQPAQELLFRQRRLLIRLGIAITAAFWVIRLVGGVGLDAESTASHGYLTRLLPVDAIFVMITVLIVRHWRSISSMERLGAVLYIAIYVLGQFVAGTRSAVLQPIITAAVAFALLRPRHHLSGRAWIRIGLSMAILLLVFPLYLAVTMYFRGLVRLTEISAIRGIEPEFLMIGIARAYTVISDRYPGLDNLVLVMQYEPPNLREYLTLPKVFLSGLGAIIPDRVLGETLPSTGKIFGVLYQGLPWDLPHEGAFLGFGIFFVYAGWLAPLLIGTLAVLTVWGMRTAAGSPLLSGWLPVYLALTLIWSGFLSGNFDVLISVMLTQTIVVVVLIKLGQWLSRNFGPADVPGRGWGTATLQPGQPERG